MIRVIRDGVVMAARDGNQLAAFLNNGWQKEAETVPAGISKAADVPAAEEALTLPDDGIPPGEKEHRQYTKSDIQRMKTEELQALAANAGISNAHETSGSRLKEVLIGHFGL